MKNTALRNYGRLISPEPFRYTSGAPAATQRPPKYQVYHVQNVKNVLLFRDPETKTSIEVPFDPDRKTVSVLHPKTGEVIKVPIDPDTGIITVRDSHTGKIVKMPFNPRYWRVPGAAPNAVAQTAGSPAQAKTPPQASPPTPEQPAKTQPAAAETKPGQPAAETSEPGSQNKGAPPTAASRSDSSYDAAELDRMSRWAMENIRATMPVQEHNRRYIRMKLKDGRTIQAEAPYTIDGDKTVYTGEEGLELTDDFADRVKKDPALAYFVKRAMSIGESPEYKIQPLRPGSSAYAPRSEFVIGQLPGEVAMDRKPVSAEQQPQTAAAETPQTGAAPQTAATPVTPQEAIRRVREAARKMEQERLAAHEAALAKINAERKASGLPPLGAMTPFEERRWRRNRKMFSELT